MTLPQAAPPYVLTRRSGLFLIELTIQRNERQMVKRFSEIVHQALRLFLIRAHLVLLKAMTFILTDDY
jgi:hypothetical protein